VALGDSAGVGEVARARVNRGCQKRKIIVPINQTTDTNESESHPVADAFAAALRRAQAEFLEMPGLQLTEAQASRLWCFDSVLCSRVLQTLVDERFLVRTRNASFLRA
jgi:hypothetical protein